MNPAAALLALATAAVPAAAGAPITPAALAGQYVAHHANGDISGARYFTDDVLEIVPTSPSAAYVRLQSYFYNGHQCSLSGIAHVEGQRLVYGPKATSLLHDCAFGIGINGSHIALSDSNGQCRSYYCGARGGLDDDKAFARAARKPIRYMARLKDSTEYKAAIKEDATR